MTIDVAEYEKLKKKVDTAKSEADKRLQASNAAARGESARSSPFVASVLREHGMVEHSVWEELK